MRSFAVSAVFVIFSFVSIPLTYSQRKIPLAYSEWSRPVKHLPSVGSAKDSVKIFFESDYLIVAPECATIIRYGHYDFAKHHFVGKFKDVSKTDTTLVVAEGNYDASGRENGHFILRYLDGKLRAEGQFKGGKHEGDWVVYHPGGKLQARGNFKNGRFNGKWEFYYSNGQPRSFMEITDDVCYISDVWTIEGEKFIDNGKGSYVSWGTGLAWHGELLNGRPDGIWTFAATDAYYGSELFDKGKFVTGKNTNVDGSTKYEKSRISFLPGSPSLVIENAQILPLGPLCKGEDYKKQSDKIFVFDK